MSTGTGASPRGAPGSPGGRSADRAGTGGDRLTTPGAPAASADETSDETAREWSRRLKARALGLLARREHSPEEMRQKLRDSLRRWQAAATQASADESVDADLPEPDPLIDALIGWLEGLDLLNAQRFIEGRIQARSGRHGSPRIRQELARHGLAPDASQAARLRAEDRGHAQALWLRRYGEVSSDPAEKARQMRFLAGRGFPPDVVRAVVNGRGGEPD